MNKCIVDGCETKSVNRHKPGLCGMHRLRLKVHGDLHHTKAKAKPFSDGQYMCHVIDGVRRAVHIRIAEDALGKPLPAGAVVHHANCNKLDNRPENLVICPDKAYHNFLHSRIRAQEACGDVNKRKCRVCLEWDHQDNLRIYPVKNGFSYWHRECLNSSMREKRRAAK